MKKIAALIKFILLTVELQGATTSSVFNLELFEFPSLITPTSVSEKGSQWLKFLSQRKWPMVNVALCVQDVHIDGFMSA